MSAPSFLILFESPISLHLFFSLDQGLLILPLKKSNPGIFVEGYSSPCVSWLFQTILETLYSVMCGYCILSLASVQLEFWQGFPCEESVTDNTNQPTNQTNKYFLGFVAWLVLDYFFITYPGLY